MVVEHVEAATGAHARLQDAVGAATGAHCTKAVAANDAVWAAAGAHARFQNSRGHGHLVSWRTKTMWTLPCIIAP